MMPPARRDDDVVGAAAVVEVSVRVDPAPILDGKPRALAPHRDLAGLTGPERLPVVADDRHLPARRRLAERARAHLEVREAGIVHDDDADLGAAVHAARAPADRLLEPLERARVHRLPAEPALPPRAPACGRPPPLAPR